MPAFNNELDRYGSAHLAVERDIARAGMFIKTFSSVFLGFFNGKPIYWNGPGGLLLTAGARGGKLKDVLAYSICSGTYLFSMLILDMKGELAAISQNQVSDRKFLIYWNPRGLHGLPQHRINPVDYIHIKNPNLVSDVKVFCENMIALSGSAQSVYFERRGREFLEAIVLTIVRLDKVLTLPRLYHFLNLIPGNTEEWLHFAFEMSESGFQISVRIEEEISTSRESQGNGFQGILGELFKAFVCLSDPVLMASVSPPYDFSLSQLCESDQAYQLYMMPPAEFIEAWGPVIKSLFVAGMIYKARAPQAPPQTWIVDECAALGAFPLVVKLFSYGAGIGIRPWCIFQSTYQMRALGPDAENIITSSAAVRSYFAVRDIDSASSISRMLGAQTLLYDDEASQARAQFAEREALQSLLTGGDPLTAGIKLAHHQQAAMMQTKQQRLLRTPDEILNMPDKKQFIFADGLDCAIYGTRSAYWEQRFMAGRFNPNPYHPPLDRVPVKTQFGHSTRRIIREPVPPTFAHYPQYVDGTWSYVEGFR